MERQVGDILAYARMVASRCFGWAQNFAEAQALGPGAFGPGAQEFVMVNKHLEEPEAMEETAVETVENTPP